MTASNMEPNRAIPADLGFAASWPGPWPKRALPAVLGGDITDAKSDLQKASSTILSSSACQRVLATREPTHCNIFFTAGHTAHRLQT